jgi:RNA polymerase sigma factor (sigma-70 family)
MAQVIVETRERWTCEGAGADLEALFAQFRPLVASICRRYLHDPGDVEDAVQETFVKLLRHMDQVESNLPGWLAAVAASTSIDIVRQSARQRARRLAVARTVLSDEATDSRWLMMEVVRCRLEEALRLVDEPTRQLIVDRFFRGLPLRDLASNAAVGLGTIHRRVQEAVAELRGAFAELGVELDGQTSLSDQLHELGDLTGILGCGDSGVRLAAYRPEPGAAARETQGQGIPEIAAAGPKGPTAQGPGRRLRVGAMISHASTVTTGGYHFAIDRAVQDMHLLADPAIDRVGLIEPGTVELPGIERTLRNFDLTSGLIDATDMEGLRTLDVIYLGYCIILPRRVLAAIIAAVRAGVGLCCEHVSGAVTPGYGDPLVRQLLLADGELLFFHHPQGCHELTQGQWVEAHPAFPGLAAGDTAPITACGPYYKPRADCQVLMVKNPAVQPNSSNRQRLPEGQRPPAVHLSAVVAGTLGRGRVININFQRPLRKGSLGHHPNLRGDFQGNIFRWLAGAEPATQAPSTPVLPESEKTK